MKPMPMDFGVCGIEQMLFAGTINFGDTDVATGIKLCDLLTNTIVTRAVAVVKTAFNAATTNVLTVGATDDVNDILGANDITGETAGSYIKQTFEQ